MERDHRVPLSDSATAILKATSVTARLPSNYVFHDGNPSVPLSTGTMAAVLKRLGVDDATVHGFRASFRTWAAESSGNYRRDIAEAALAHMTKDKTAAYQRGELFDLRICMMADWDAFLFPVRPTPGSPAATPEDGNNLALGHDVDVRARAMRHTMRASAPGVSRHGFLFVSITGAPLSRWGANEIFARLRRAAAGISAADGNTGTRTKSNLLASASAAIDSAEEYVRCSFTYDRWFSLGARRWF